MGLMFTHHLTSILAIWVLCLALQTTSFCCKPTKISFVLAAPDEGETCESFGGTKNNEATCSASICNDGKPPRGKVCSRGECDSNGCGCTRRCTKQHYDPIVSFSEKYGFYNFINIWRS